MRVVLALIVVLGTVLTSCLGDDNKKFSIDNFTLRAITIQTDGSTNKDATSPIKALDLGYVLRVTNSVSGNAPSVSKESITAFTITSDSTLTITNGETFPPQSNLFSKFQGSEEILNNTIHDWDYEFVTMFAVAKKQKHNFTFHITLSDGRKLDVGGETYELLPQ